ncbi:MAG: hypothetical protein WCT52_02380 [Candidatus Micrarchaeia archaeon]
MDKSDWYKILAIGFVLVFVFEMVAIGALNNNSNTNGGTGNAGATTLTGNATEDMTLVRYEPYIAVTGNGSAVDEAKKKLLDSGVATYEVPAKDAFVLNLKSGKDVPAAAAEFEKINASVLATAVLNTPSKITVENEGIVTKADGASFTMQLRPLYDEGASVPVSFTAYVQDGQLYTISNMVFLPSYVLGARIPTEFEGVMTTAYVEVAWENRSAAKAIVKGMNATYKEKSYIILKDAADAQLNATLAATKAYSTGAENGVLSVQNGFVDKERAASDIASAGIASGSFPPSVASFANDTNGSLAAALDAKLKAAGVGSNLVEINLVKLKFPAEFEYNGKKYSSAGYEIELEGTAPTSGKTVWLEADFESLGGKISRFGAISISADQGEGETAIVDGQNGSISINGTGAEVIGNSSGNGS